MDQQNQRNLVLQVHAPLILLSAFLRLSKWQKSWRIVICSAAHRWHNFVLAVFMSNIRLNFQRMLTLMCEQHFSATSAFLLKQRCFTGEKRCWARAEQFSCLGWGGGGAASIDCNQQQRRGWTSDCLVACLHGYLWWSWCWRVSSCEGAFVASRLIWCVVVDHNTRWLGLVAD